MEINSEANPTSVSAKPAAKADTVETVTDGLAVLQSLVSPDPRAGEVLEPARSRGAVTTAKGCEQLISAAFSSVADHMQLQVTRAASHFNSRPAVAGQATPPMKTSLHTSLDHDGLDNPGAGCVDTLSPVVAESLEGAGPSLPPETRAPPSLPASRSYSYLSRSARPQGRLRQRKHHQRTLRSHRPNLPRTPAARSPASWKSSSLLPGSARFASE